VAAPILRERPSRSLGNAAPEVADESVANVEPIIGGPRGDRGLTDRNV
jgi:hypothetical protein